jgi:hypothetical protein
MRSKRNTKAYLKHIRTKRNDKSNWRKKEKKVGLKKEREKAEEERRNPIRLREKK